MFEAADRPPPHAGLDRLTCYLADQVYNVIEDACGCETTHLIVNRRAGGARAVPAATSKPTSARKLGMTTKKRDQPYLLPQERRIRRAQLVG
ncbi:hypothetical protein LRE75_17375 [Streptomyces sp. 372A]